MHLHVTAKDSFHHQDKPPKRRSRCLPSICAVLSDLCRLLSVLQILSAQSCQYLMQRFDDAAVAKYPAAARFFGTLYSNPTFAAIAPCTRPKKAFTYHESGQPWGEGPPPLSPELRAVYGHLPWSGKSQHADVFHYAARMLHHEHVLWMHTVCHEAGHGRPPNHVEAQEVCMQLARCVSH